jgi:hypothetical protein
MTLPSVEDLAEQNARLATFCWILAATISLLLCFVQLGVMVSLLAGRVLFPLVFPAAVLGALIVGNRLLRRDGFARPEQWKAAGILLLLLGSSLALSAFFFDFSWDGEWYHQAGIIHIARDWNPLTDPMRNFVDHIVQAERHYAKGPWYFAAAVWGATGHIEWGKAINWLALAASFSALFAAALNGGLRRRYALGIAAAVAINPVVMSELTTSMVDAVMISFLVVAAAALFTCLHRPSAPALIAGVAGAIVSINAKFTGLIYLCFALAAGALWCMLKRRAWWWKFALAAAAALVLGVCVWGYNPYLTNTYYRHQPFYPLLGSAQYPSLEKLNQDDNERWETPKNLVGRSLPLRFFYAVFGRPGNQPYTKGRNASLMWPFTAVPADLYAYKYHETRVSGFGPFFSGCVVLAFLLGAWMLLGKEPSRWLMVLMAVTILASLSLSRHLWWPRYGPQFWLLPILPVAFTLRQSSSRFRLWLARILLCLLVVNAAVVSFVRLHWETKASITLRHQLRQMRDSGREYEVRTMYFDDSTNVRLHEAGIKFRDVGMKSMPDSAELMSVIEEYPAPVRYRVAPDPPPPQIQPAK